MKYKSLLLAMASVISLSACQKEQASTPAATEQATQMTKEQLQQLPENQQQAYALGENMGKYVTTQTEQYQQFGLEFDVEKTKEGFLAAISGNSILSDEEATKLLQALQMQAQQKQQEFAAAEGQKNKEAGLAYLEENKKREGVMVTESGIQYEVLTQGDGAKPVAEDTVKVHYHGTLIDGTVFDSSVERGEPTSFPLNRVIAGWTEGVQLMNVGSKYRFHIPSELAYGARATGKIQPHSTLVFDVELLAIETK